MRLLTIDPVDRNIICRDSFKSCFNKLLVSRGIEVQNDGLKIEVVSAKWTKWGSYIFGTISSAFMMYDYITKQLNENGWLLAGAASTIRNRTITMINGGSYGYGVGEEDEMVDFVSDLRSIEGTARSSTHAMEWYLFLVPN